MNVLTGIVRILSSMVSSGTCRPVTLARLAALSSTVSGLAVTCCVYGVCVLYVGGVWCMCGVCVVYVWCGVDVA